MLPIAVHDRDDLASVDDGHVFIAPRLGAQITANFNEQRLKVFFAMFLNQLRFDFELKLLFPPGVSMPGDHPHQLALVLDWETFCKTRSLCSANQP